MSGPRTISSRRLAVLAAAPLLVLSVAACEPLIGSNDPTAAPTPVSSLIPAAPTTAGTPAPTASPARYRSNEGHFYFRSADGRISCGILEETRWAAGCQGSDLPAPPSIPDCVAINGAQKSPTVMFEDGQPRFRCLSQWIFAGRLGANQEIEPPVLAPVTQISAKGVTCSAYEDWIACVQDVGGQRISASARGLSIG